MTTRKTIHTDEPSITPKLEQALPKRAKSKLVFTSLSGAIVKRLSVISRDVPAARLLQ